MLFSRAVGRNSEKTKKILLRLLGQSNIGKPIERSGHKAIWGYRRFFGNASRLPSDFPMQSEGTFFAYLCFSCLPGLCVLKS